jgi:hypothetical protein
MANDIPAENEIPVEPEPTVPTAAQRKTQLIIAAVAGAILIVMVLLIALAFSNPAATETARDLAIISMAVVSVAIGVMLVILVYQVAMLIQLLRDEIKPLLESAHETMNTLRGTTVFMSENLVEPTIKASSTFAGVQRIIQVLFGARKV